jgi:hypothetical protein
MTDHTDDHRSAVADITFRRRALKVNGGIYARRHAPRLKPLLIGAGPLRARYIAVTEWLGSERDWRPEDARRLAAMAEEIDRLGLRCRDGAEACDWHANRLRELVRQHDVLAKLEAGLCPLPAWPAVPVGKRASASSPSHRRRA